MVLALFKQMTLFCSSLHEIVEIIRNWSGDKFSGHNDFYSPGKRRPQSLWCSPLLLRNLKQFDSLF